MYNEQAFKIFQSYLYSKRGKKMKIYLNYWIIILLACANFMV
jgi:hypothetical protein